jgi:hypothetical protein
MNAFYRQPATANHVATASAGRSVIASANNSTPSPEQALNHTRIG